MRGLLYGRGRQTARETVADDDEVAPEHVRRLDRTAKGRLVVCGALMQP